MEIYSDEKIEQMMKDNSYIETTLRGNKNNSNKGKYNDNPNKWFLGRLPNMLRLGWAERMDALAPEEWLLISKHEFYPDGVPTRKTHRRRVKSNAYNHAYSLNRNWPDYEFIARKVFLKGKPIGMVFGRRKKNE